MSNFNYNNYIGLHMSEPLMVEYIDFNNEKCIAELTGINKDYLFLSSKNIEDVELYSKHCKPIIRPIESLTDEEICFLLKKDKNDRTIMWTSNSTIEFYRNKNKLFTYYFDGGKLNFHDNILDIQEILNRLYSLHISLNYKYLVKNNLAVRK